MGKETNRAISSNKKAFHNYTISEKYEAGIVLEGCEVKSIRNGKITLQESYARFFGEELWLVGCHITPYFAATHDPPDPLRNQIGRAHV